jgi:hypothetical protein
MLHLCDENTRVVRVLQLPLIRQREGNQIKSSVIRFRNLIGRIFSFHFRSTVSLVLLEQDENLRVL